MTAFIIGLLIGLAGATTFIIWYIMYLKRTGYIKMEATDKLIALLKS